MVSKLYIGIFNQCVNSVFKFASLWLFNLTLSEGQIQSSSPSLSLDFSLYFQQFLLYLFWGCLGGLLLTQSFCTCVFIVYRDNMMLFTLPGNSFPPISPLLVTWRAHSIQVTSSERHSWPPCQNRGPVMFSLFTSLLVFIALITTNYVYTSITLSTSFTRTEAIWRQQMYFCRAMLYYILFPAFWQWLAHCRCSRNTYRCLLINKWVNAHISHTIYLTCLMIFIWVLFCLSLIVLTYYPYSEFWWHFASGRSLVSSLYLVFASLLTWGLCVLTWKSNSFTFTVIADVFGFTAVVWSCLLLFLPPFVADMCVYFTMCEFTLQILLNVQNNPIIHVASKETEA